MKSGLTIVEMAQQIERQSKLKHDYLLDTRRLQVEPFGSQLYLHTFDDHDDPLVEPLEINQIAHRQIGTHLKIPAAYYDHMLSDYPELLAENVNSWFQREPTQRMVRTLDGTVRAFLSNRYRRIDNLDIAEIVLPVIQQMGGDVDEITGKRATMIAAPWKIWRGDACPVRFAAIFDPTGEVRIDTGV